MKNEKRKKKIARQFMCWRSIGGERGASLVETALFLAIFGPLLMFGTFETSELVYASIEISDAARAAASYAAEYYIANSNSLPTQLQVTSAAQNNAPVVLNLLKSGTQLTATMATGCGTAAATVGNSVPSCSSGTLPYVQVTAQATIAPLVQFSGLLGTPTISTQAKINLVN